MNLSRIFSRPQPPVATPEPDTALDKHLIFRELARRYPTVRLVGEGLRLEPMSIGDLARVTWTINRANGFPDCQGDGIPVALVLIHDEISEAYEKTKYHELYVEEVADVFIRTLDLAESVFPGHIAEAFHPFAKPHRLPHVNACEGNLLHTHLLVSQCLRMFRNTSQGELMPDSLLEYLGHILQAADWEGRCTVPDFDAVIRAKLEKNSRRPYRHGGKRI